MEDTSCDYNIAHMVSIEHMITGNYIIYTLHCQAFIIPSGKKKRDNHL